MGNRAYCYAEHVVSSLVVADTNASAHCAYSQRDGQAELAWVAGYMPRWYARQKTVAHPSTNRARRRVTSLIRHTPLQLRQTATPTITGPNYRLSAISASGQRILTIDGTAEERIFYRGKLNATSATHHPNGLSIRSSVFAGLWTSYVQLRVFNFEIKCLCYTDHATPSVAIGRI